MTSCIEARTYHGSESVVFFKTKERFGGLSNMASGYPLCVNGVPIRTSEALYQLCRFPYDPDVQRMIVNEISPMTAKMKSKPFRHLTRPDWDEVKIRVMKWAIRVKLCQNWPKFSSDLFETGEFPIVEKKIKRVDFWGATERDDGTLFGKNVLGRLLMELRDQARVEGEMVFRVVQPLNIPDFFLFGERIGTVASTGHVEGRLF